MPEKHMPDKSKLGKVLNLHDSTEIYNEECATAKTKATVRGKLLWDIRTSSRMYHFSLASGETEVVSLLEGVADIIRELKAACVEAGLEGELEVYDVTFVKHFGEDPSSCTMTVYFALPDDE